MRRSPCSLLLVLSLVLGLGVSQLGAHTPPMGAPAEELSEAWVESPLRQREAMLRALREDDIAAWFLTISDDQMLAGFLSDGSDKTEAELDAKFGDSLSDTDQDMLRLWTQLADGSPAALSAASAHWYPLWLEQLPSLLAGAQMGLVAMASGAAEDSKLNPLLQTQLNELHWAISAWLNRTDFGDRARFDQVVRLASDWVRASGKRHPVHLKLTTPEQRLELAGRAMGSVKSVLGLYGLDADAVLKSVRFTELQRDGDTATIRTELRVLGVLLQVDEELAWYNGRWMDRTMVGYMRGDYGPGADDDAAIEDFDEQFESDLSSPAPGFAPGGCGAPAESI